MDKLQIESTTLWDFPRQNYGDKPHGSNKYNGVTPAFVIWNLLQRYTKEGDLVVDPFNGSGTTGVVAHKLGREYIGMEMDENFLELTKKRILNVKKQTELNSY